MATIIIKVQGHHQTKVLMTVGSSTIYMTPFLVGELREALATAAALVTDQGVPPDFNFEKTLRQ